MEFYFPNALAAVAPHLRQNQLQQALTAAKAIHLEDLRSEALATLAPYLGPEQLQGQCCNFTGSP